MKIEKKIRDVDKSTFFVMLLCYLNVSLFIYLNYLFIIYI